LSKDSPPRAAVILSAAKDPRVRRRSRRPLGSFAALRMTELEVKRFIVGRYGLRRWVLRGRENLGEVAQQARLAPDGERVLVRGAQAELENAEHGAEHRVLQLVLHPGGRLAAPGVEAENAGGGLL